MLGRLLPLSTADRRPARAGVDADIHRNRLPRVGAGDIHCSYGCMLVAIGLSQRLCMQDLTPIPLWFSNIRAADLIHGIEIVYSEDSESNPLAYEQRFRCDFGCLSEKS